jgi:hypothetical protein
MAPVAGEFDRSAYEEVMNHVTVDLFQHQVETW